MKSKGVGRKQFRVEQAPKPLVICEVCGATFKDRRGLNGHMAGKHGKKWGVNATLDEMGRVLEGINAKLSSLDEGLNKRDVLGQRLVELAHSLAQKPWGMCGDREREEFDLLKEAIRGK